MNKDSLKTGSLSKMIRYNLENSETYGQEEVNLVSECMRKGKLEVTKLFESKVARVFGKKFALFVDSGFSANLLALLSLELQEGDEVITPACCFSTTVSPIIQAKLTPIFCDVELNTYLPSPYVILEKITDRTKVIMLPSLFGNKPDWILLKELLVMRGRKITLIEDSGNAMSWTDTTDICTTSFTDNLITTGGSGGVVMFNDEKLLKIATMYRDWGRTELQYDIGFNFKSSELNSSIGLVQLGNLEKIKEKRRTLIERYKKNLGTCQSYILPDDSLKPDWIVFPLIYKGDKSILIKYLESKNVKVSVCYSGNITRKPAFKKYSHAFPNSDQIMDSGILVGCDTNMSGEDVDSICKLLLEKDLSPSFSPSQIPNVFNSHSIKPSDIIVNKDSVVIGVIGIIEMSPTPILGYASRTIFTPQERFEQTLAQLKSVREKIPEAVVILLDGSEDISHAMTAELAKYANYVILFKDNIEALSYCHKSFRNKGLGEMYTTIFLLSLLKDKEFGWFCKFGGRSVLSPEFSINPYKANCPVVKCVKWKGKLGVMALTNFYSIPRRLINHYMEHLKTWLSPNTDEPIEHVLTFFLESIKGDIKFVDRLFVEGRSGVTGIFQEL